MDEKIPEISTNPGFPEENESPKIIKVVGVGGGGNNAVGHMYKQDIEGVSFVVINTDKQALKNSPVHTRLLIGPETTKGLGAGNDPEKARVAAEESSNEINALFDDATKMVFITAGMGGGTGTGAGPVVSRIARERDLLTVGIVTIPFLFEGQKKIIKALEGAKKMREFVDALLIINNERLTDIYPDLSIDDAFEKSDDTLSVAARSISELITKNGKINLDFNDVNTTLKNGGVAIISSGYGEGERRVTKAIENALESPLLKNRDIRTSKRILFNFYYNPNAKNPFKMKEIDEVKEFMARFGSDVDTIWGTTKDETLDDRIKITVLAAGFEMSLENDEPTKSAAESSTKRREPEAAPNKDTEAAKKEMESIYGDNLREFENTQAAAQYVLLRPEDLDNDDIIEKLESTPTYGRPPQFKSEIEALQAAPKEEPEKVVLTPEVTKKNGENGGIVLNFGEDS